MLSYADGVRKWRQTTKQRMIDSMGGKCQCCGYNVCPKVLTFHHLNPFEKDLALGDARANPKKWATIVIELRKCILVCMNCHAEIHAEVREVPETFERFDEEFADYRKVVEEQYDTCSICFQPKLIHQRYCSQKCAQKSRYRFNWDSIDLLAMLKKHPISELEKMFGVSNAAIYKRRNKLLSAKAVDREQRNCDN